MAFSVGRLASRAAFCNIPGNTRILFLCVVKVGSPPCSRYLCRRSPSREIPTQRVRIDHGWYQYLKMPFVQQQPKIRTTRRLISCPHDYLQPGPPPRVRPDDVHRSLVQLVRGESRQAPVILVVACFQRIMAEHPHVRLGY